MARTGVALVLVAVLVGGCGGAGRPHFAAAPGWYAIAASHGLEAAAANVPFAARDRSFDSPPIETVKTLPRNGIVVWATFAPRSGSGGYSPLQLPLHLSEAVASNPFEGFGCAPAVAMSRCYAASGSILRIDASARGYLIDVIVFFGTDRPSRSARAAANGEIARLVT